MQNLSSVFNLLAGAPTLFGVLLASGTIFLTSDWRLSLTALLVQYVCVGLLLTRSIQGEIAILKALTGVLAVLMLYITVRRVQEERELLPEQREPSAAFRWGVADPHGSLGLVLRLSACVLVVLALVQGIQERSFPLGSRPFCVRRAVDGGIRGTGTGAQRRSDPGGHGHPDDSGRV